MRADDRKMLNGLFWRLRTAAAPWAGLPTVQAPGSSALGPIRIEAHWTAARSLSSRVSYRQATARKRLSLLRNRSTLLLWRWRGGSRLRPGIGRDAGAGVLGVARRRCSPSLSWPWSASRVWPGPIPSTGSPADFPTGRPSFRLALGRLQPDRAADRIDQRISSSPRRAGDPRNGNGRLFPTIGGVLMHPDRRRADLRISPWQASGMACGMRDRRPAVRRRWKRFTQVAREPCRAGTPAQSARPPSIAGRGLSASEGHPPAARLGPSSAVTAGSRTARATNAMASFPTGAR